MIFITVLSEASDNHFLRGNSFSPVQPEQEEFSVQNLFMALLVNLQFSVTFRANGEKILLPLLCEKCGLGFVNS